MKTPKHLGGHQEVTHTDRGALSYMMGRHGCESMIDIGCGPGGQVEIARCLGMTANGIDGDVSCKPDIVHDFTHGPLAMSRIYDLAWSVEFLEHVEEQYIENFLPVFAACKFAVITAAPPGKKGHHHVNCQPEGYWLEKFSTVRMYMDTVATEELRRESTMKREFIQRGLVLRRE